eukprot:650287-Pelagomonas_calceolata.AAC.4
MRALCATFVLKLLLNHPLLFDCTLMLAAQNSGCGMSRPEPIHPIPPTRPLHRIGHARQGTGHAAHGPPRFRGAEAGAALCAAHHALKAQPGLLEIEACLHSCCEHFIECLTVPLQCQYCTKMLTLELLFYPHTPELEWDADLDDVKAQFILLSPWEHNCVPFVCFSLGTCASVITVSDAVKHLLLQATCSFWVSNRG